MSGEIKIDDAEVVAYAVVRDRNGKPKFDDISNIPEPMWEMLSDGEQDEILEERKSLNL